MHMCVTCVCVSVWGGGNVQVSRKERGSLINVGVGDKENWKEEEERESEVETSC